MNYFHTGKEEKVVINEEKIYIIHCNDSVRKAENCTTSVESVESVESVPLCKLEADNIVTDTGGEVKLSLRYLECLCQSYCSTGTKEII